VAVRKSPAACDGRALKAIHKNLTPPYSACAVQSQIASVACRRRLRAPITATVACPGPGEARMLGEASENWAKVEAFLEGGP
jgi:hypothetical protein